MTLSQRRADAVRNALVREGVPATAITGGGQGEASLPVQTADNVDERRNRSVDIAVVGADPVARTGMTDAEYCASIRARTYRDYRTSQADEDGRRRNGAVPGGQHGGRHSSARENADGGQDSASGALLTIAYQWAAVCDDGRPAWPSII